MHVFSWLDGGTLIACDFMLAIAFALVFFGMRRSYPNLRGMNSIGISFLVFVFGIFLAVSATPIPWFVSGGVAIGCIFTSFVFLYRGVLRFIGSRRTAALPIALSSFAVAVLYYFSHVHDKVGPRIVAISLTIGAIRALIALELFRKSPTSPSPTTMRLFATSMLLFGAITVNAGLACAIRGTYLAALHMGAFDSPALLLSVVSIFVTGLFILLLSSGELIAASRDESQKDSLSGAFNRRGIEVKLAAELKRVHSGKTKLSIALIDVDYFKSINDIQGHAAGDAALRDVAFAISTHLRGRDYLGRYGGDEFLLILPQTPCSIAVGVTERLCQAVSNRVVASGIIPLTLSIGLTEAVPEDDAVTLIARADKALYQAKSDGRNCRRVVIANTAEPAA
ncbi:MAG TPA: GGDEF domain-containing protein, partial [Acidobacteriaceae bacterium]|nr:GGDEF domain-containing protein [Acidobacteriaceae bacterium]